MAIDKRYYYGQYGIDIEEINQGQKLMINKSNIPIYEELPIIAVLDKIRAEIERLHYHPKLDFIKNDEVVDMALEIIDKYMK